MHEYVLEILRQIRVVIEPILFEKGFKILDERVDRGCFGNMFILYSKKHTAIRLVWDGRESWILLEQNKNPGAIAGWKWTDIFLEQIDHEVKKEIDIGLIVNSFRDSLLGYLNK